ncbi:MAG: hypothetical protein LC623_09645 [Halobacteriales archaeon]|nr:hypothetical protein [Halobacteriales archaeon]
MKPTPLLLTALMLTLLAAAPPATACSGNLDDRCTYPDSGASDGVDDTPIQGCPASPGPFPTGGLVPDTAWYVAQSHFLDCNYADAWENLLADNGGDVAWRAGQGAAGLLGTAGVGPVATAYATDLQDVATSEAHDACANLISPGYPPCGSGNEVHGAYAGCTPVPNPVGPGGLTGDTLKNANGLAQATCQFQADLGAAAAPGTLAGLLLATATSVQAEAGQAMAQTVTQATTETFDFLSHTNEAACLWIFKTSSCP